MGVRARPGESHVFNVVNVKGDVIFLDGQTGHANPRPYRNYGLLRTDQ
ncbi:toxin glutamine deamidase domain-containing protein [Streptomyces lushanensis]